MVRLPREFKDAAKDFVAVRVVNMLGVDLSTFVFDYDLTFAILLMNADGTVYHRYGTRDHRSSTDRMSVAALVRVMKGTLEDHRDYVASGVVRSATAVETVEQMPPMRRRLEKKAESCAHCHTVNDMRHEMAVESKSFDRASIWRWPLPEVAGFELDFGDPERVKAVAPKSPAAAAGFEPGDRLVKLGGQRIRSEADVQWVFHNAAPGATAIAFVSRRGQKRRDGRLELPADWKVGTPLTFSWRPSMWPLDPNPGFGGEVLDALALEKLGLPPKSFALRVDYIIDWGERAALGRNAKEAGVRKGDVVLSVDEERDFRDGRHFQAWFRLTRKAGAVARLEIMRGKERMNLKLPILP